MSPCQEPGLSFVLPTLGLGANSLGYPTFIIVVRNQIATSHSIQAGGQLLFVSQLHQPGFPLFLPSNDRSATSTTYVIDHKTSSAVESSGATPIGQPSRGLVGFPDGRPSPAITSDSWHTVRLNVLITFTITEKRRRMVKSRAHKPL